MSKVRNIYEALRDENERLAREAEREMLNPELSSREQRDAMERAKIYWQLSRNAADTVVNDADADRRRLLGQNAGTQKATTAKKQFLLMIANKINQTKHEAVTEEAVARHFERVKNLWAVEDAELARKKIRTFLKNQKPLKGLTFEN
jgi:hypothetical protein